MLTDKPFAYDRIRTMIPKRILDRILKEKGWALARSKNHMVYKRLVNGVTEQTFVMPATPSNRFHVTLSMQVLQQLDNEAEVERVTIFEKQPHYPKANFQ